MRATGDFYLRKSGFTRNDIAVRQFRTVMGARGILAVVRKQQTASTTGERVMTDKWFRTKWTLPLLASAVLLLPAAALADAHSEIATAATHAGLASKAGTLKMVQTHLHHTLNCLVGPKGAAFDATEMNPCAHSGNGAIPDATDAKTKTALKAAVAEAEAGLKEDQLKSAQEAAAKVAAMLKAAE